jgi:hypothetical protein
MSQINMKIVKSTIAAMGFLSKMGEFDVTIKKGNSLRTINSTNSVIAFVKVENQFPNDFVVSSFDILVKSLKLFDSPILEFKEEYINITGFNSDIVKLPYGSTYFSKAISELDEITFPTVDIHSFELKAYDINLIKKSCSILSLDCIRFISDANTIYITATDTIFKSQNDIKISIGKSNVAFDIPINSERFSYLPDVDLKVTAHDQMVRFDSTIHTIIIATSATFVNEKTEDETEKAEDETEKSGEKS